MTLSMGYWLIALGWRRSVKSRVCGNVYKVVKIVKLPFKVTGIPGDALRVRNFIKIPLINDLLQKYDATTLDRDKFANYAPAAHNIQA